MAARSARRTASRPAAGRQTSRSGRGRMSARFDILSSHRVIVIGKLRLLVGALVVYMAIAPAIVRATRVVDPSGRPTIALSFKTSFDVPPHVVEVPPDLSVSPLVVVQYSIAAPAPL